MFHDLLHISEEISLLLRKPWNLEIQNSENIKITCSQLIVSTVSQVDMWADLLDWVPSGFGCHPRPAPKVSWY